VVIPDQLIDFTKGGRKVTFFENGLVSHIGVADPFCEQLRPLLADAVVEAGGTVHRKGKFITVEGPRFSTRGESHLFRSWGMDIIGMTTSPEAFLAREAEMCYAVMAHVTDYDVWHETEEEVTVEMVIKAFQQNLKLAQDALEIVIPKVAALQEAAPAHSALKSSLTTNKTHVSDEQREKLKPFLKNLLGDE
jgi:5'-methylthioadenosine phosphorylase